MTQEAVFATETAVVGAKFREPCGNRIFQIVAVEPGFVQLLLAKESKKALDAGRRGYLVSIGELEREWEWVL